MSTEARRASIPPRPATPPPPAAPPRPPHAPMSLDAEADMATGTGRDAGTPAQQPPAGPFLSFRTTSEPPAAPGFPNPPHLAPRTDAMPPPPVSARFPDTPPPAGRPDEGPSRPGAYGPEEGPRPTAPGGGRPAPAQTPPATRPNASGTSRPARQEAARPAGPDGAAPTGAEGADPARAGIPRPARLDATRSTGANPSGAPGPEAPRPAGPAAPRPARLDNNRRPRPDTAPANDPRPTEPTGAPSTAPDTTRSPEPRAQRPPEPYASRPTASEASAPARSAAPRSGVKDGGPSATDTDRTPTGTRDTDGTPPTPARPAAPAPRTPAPDHPRPPAPAPGTAWTPLPRAWVPAPAQHRDGLSTAVPGRHPEEDARPAWSPATPLRHPDFDTPPPSAEAGPDPALSWSAPMTPGGAPGATRPVVTFARPEGYGDTPRAGWMRLRGHAVAAAACVVLGLGLIGGAVTGSWLVGDPADAGEPGVYATAGGLWHNVPVDQLFPPTVDGQGAGPGGADRTWTRIAVAPDSGCAGAFDPLLAKALAPVGCARLLRATYTDATRSHVTTVGMLFTKADAAGMRALDTRFDREGLARRTDLMPRPYAAKGTVAAAFGDGQRASWTVSVLTDAPVVVYAVSGWADGRTVATPQSAVEATASGATTAAAQAGVGNEAKGLADRIERGLRKAAVSPSEPPS
ncbi:hypothetical protein ABZ137_15895 [Streptomyces bobili]|uniref:hypothetical protein n=1 Tax=Streptomyces bobili TaxID=67280 RepID=UPI00339E8573